MAEAAVTLTSTAMKIEKESELLFRGRAYMKAIESYYYASPQRKEYPQALEDLLIDPRFPMKRHIRKLYEDPLTGKMDWRVIRNSEGIVGVVSRVTDAPLKSSNFPTGLEGLEGASSYSQWFFVFESEDRRYGS